MLIGEKVFYIHLRVPQARLSPWVRKWGLVIVLFFCLVVEPSTNESIVLSTYYPSPTGAYNNMVSIGNTWLAQLPNSNGSESFVELGSNSFLGASNVKLDIENGAVRVTSTTVGQSDDHWIGTDAGGANLALFGESGGGVEIETNNHPAVDVIANQETQFLNHVSIGNYPNDPNPTANNFYLHVNGSGCQAVLGYVWGAGDQSCNGADEGADNCQCPSGYYATWVPGIYVETGLTSLGWFHPRYEWGVLVYNPTTKQNQYYDVGGTGGTVNIYSSVDGGNSWGYNEVLVPGRNYNPLLTNTNPPTPSDAYGNQFFYCCPK